MGIGSADVRQEREKGYGGARPKVLQSRMSVSHTTDPQLTGPDTYVPTTAGSSTHADIPGSPEPVNTTQLTPYQVGTSTHHHPDIPGSPEPVNTAQLTPYQVGHRCCGCYM